MSGGPRPSSADRLIKRLRAMGLDLPDVVQLRHTHAGPNQKAVGAWSWYLVDADGGELRIGGYLAVTELLPKRLVASRSHGGSGSIDVDDFRWNDRRVPGAMALWLVEPERVAKNA